MADYNTQMSAHMPKGQDEWAEPEPQEKEVINERLEAFVGKLEAEAKRRVDRRIHIEQRWLRDLRQYHGIYDQDIIDELKKMEGSKIFMNLTRAKTNRFISKLWDLLFPTDDKNWAINPTPVPELQEKAENAAALAEDAVETFEAKQGELKDFEAKKNDPAADEVAAEMEELETVVKQAQSASDELKDAITAARKKSDMMSAEIDDQLKEAMYQAANRDMIEDAAKIGIGVLKGPVLGEKYKQRWRAVQTQDGRTMHVLEAENNNRVPETQRVDPWNFYPDPDYVKVEDGNGVFERDLASAKKLRRLAKMPDVDEEAIREILRAAPQDAAPSYMTDLTTLTHQDTNATVRQYHVWEYTGPIDHEDIEILIQAGIDNQMGEMFENEVDPLAELHVKIWFCQGKIIKFALHPLDSNETIYSVFCPEKDETSPFGFGIPYLLRDSQSVLNASWRKLMDNSGLAVGPQVVVNKNMVTPENGSWVFKGMKFWTWKSNDMAASGQTPFATFDIPSHMTELQALIEMSRKEIDEIVDIASGSQESEMGPMAQQTATGIALLLNASNVVYRRAVKNYDDDVTVPMIRRFYHWNMQFSTKEHIKGDYEVDARGSSVLLVREMMAQNLMAIAANFGDHPVYGEWLKNREMLEHLFRSIMIPAKEIVKTEREYKADMKAKQENQQQDPAVIELQMQAEQKDKDRELKGRELDTKIAIAEMESDSRVQVAELSYEEEMIKLAETLGIEQDKIAASIQTARERTQAQIATKRAETQSKERALATEVAMRERTGESAGGSV